MNIEQRRLENGIVEFMIYGETHTLLRPLTEELRNNPDITFVSYVEVHPLKKQMKLLVKSKDNNEIDKLMATIAILANELKKYKEQINNTIS